MPAVAALVLLPLIASLDPQVLVQRPDGQWVIEAQETDPPRLLDARRIDYGAWDSIEPVQGLRVAVSTANGTDSPIRSVVLFQPGSMVVPATARRELQALAEAFADDPIAVEGHADPQGDASYNRILARQRAAAVARVLREAGARQVAVHSLGETQPVCRDNDPDCAARNRRVVIRVGASREEN